MLFNQSHDGEKIPRKDTHDEGRKEDLIVLILQLLNSGTSRLTKGNFWKGPAL